jgi:uncharacterized protein YebE (UPF0316 family)
VCPSIGAVWPVPVNLPILVFFAETCVVTLSTVRTIFIARGWKILAPILGFFEVSIWLFAIAQVMQHLTSPGCFLAFAGGFALGNYLGVFIEQKLALGEVVVHVVSKKESAELIDSLRWAGFGVTALDAWGASGPVHVTFTIIRRGELDRAVSIIKRCDPQALYSVGDLRSAAEGVFHSRRRWPSIFPSFFQRPSQGGLVLGPVTVRSDPDRPDPSPISKRAG